MAEKKMKKESSSKIRVTLVKSVIGSGIKQIRTVEALGLKKVGQNKIHTDNDVIRGMIFVVRHLVKVEGV